MVIYVDMIFMCFHIRASNWYIYILPNKIAETARQARALPGAILEINSDQENQGQFSMYGWAKSQPLTDLTYITTSFIGLDLAQPYPWWRHQMETFSVLLAICVGNSPVTGEFPAQRPVTRGFWRFLWSASE